MTTLHDRLEHVSEQAHAPVPDVDALWQQGHRWRNRRRTGAALVVASAACLVVGVGAVVGLPSTADRTTPPADVPFEDLHIPREVYQPAEWAEGTAETGPPGPLAAVGMADRKRRDGLFWLRDERAVFGVSAVDGSTHWLDLPEANPEFLYSSLLALTPDGTRVGYTVSGPDGVKGWGVYDVMTGESTQLRDPVVREIVGEQQFALGFSGDSRYLQTNYSLAGSKIRTDDSFVVWDVETGEQIEAEGTGHRYLPNTGSAPTGIVWSRDETTYRLDPATGETTSWTTPQRVVEWSVGPGAKSAYLAYGERKNDKWRVFTGGGSEIRIPDDARIDSLAGWRDADTLVLQSAHTMTFYFVDVTSGALVGTETIDSSSADSMKLFNPHYASDMWANPLVPGVPPPVVEDPRPTRAQVALVVVPAIAIGALGLVLWRRRVRA